MKAAALASIQMCKLIWLCLWLVLPLALGELSPSNATALTQLASSNNNSSTELLPNAEKLIRYRRHPPHGKRGKHRRRTKGPSPKTKYGPPSYPPEPPISYYKPAPSYPTHHDLPSFSLDDFQHLKFDGTDFNIPASSYEAQSMDLDLYSHDGPDLYGAHKFPSLEYSIAGGHESPAPSLSSYDHQPHQKYGVPPLHQSYDSHDAYVGHSYEPPAPAHPPSTKYGVPSVPSLTHTAVLPPPDSYSIYEQKIPNAGYHHSFAEPPRAPPKSNFEISYSPPAYEISTSFQANEPQYDHDYVPPSPGHSYQAPAPAPSPGHSYQPAAPSAGHSYHPPAPSPGHSYQPPTHDIYQPPASPHDSYQPIASPPSHSYHPPSSSHDSYQPVPSLDPSYEPAPSPGHSYEPTPSPGHSYEPAPPAPSHDYQPPASSHDSYQPPPPSHDYQSPQDGHFAEPPPQHPASNYAPPDTHQSIQSYPKENYAPPAEELPLTPNHKFPSFDFPKSSYEVPIYDPIPFESSNKEEQESYPPILPDNTPNELPTDDAHAAGSSRNPTKSRKRKRRPSAVVSKKHTLDVPELQQAYDADAHVHTVRDTALDTAAHGTSHYVEKKRKYVSFVTPSTTTVQSTTTSTASPWSPMRLRTTSSNAFVPTLITSTPTPPSTRSRGRGTSRFRSRYPSTEAASTVVTIEKSRSKSYYDGTIAPPTYQHQYTVGRGSRPTRPSAQFRGGSTLALQPGTNTERSPTPKRTTKGIFDTTLFKSPQTDREIERKLQALRQNLPKNHKLY